MLKNYRQTGGTASLTFDLPDLLAAVAAPIAALRLSADGMLRPVSVNPALSDLLGAAEQDLAIAVAGGVESAAGRHMVEVGGRSFDVMLHPLATPGDASPLVIGTFARAQPDLAGEGSAQITVRELEQRLQLALRAGGFGVWENHLATERVRYDPAHLDRHGWGGDAFDLPVHVVRDRIHPRDRARVRSAYNQCRRGERVLVRIEYRVLRQDGSYAWVEEHATVAERDARGRPLRLIGMSADISARKETEQRLAHLALHDPLTGLPNRRALADALDRALARAQRSGLALAVLALDLDGFKAINDGYGHPMGDTALVEIADRLRRTVRRSDVVARLGGDEFAVIAGELKGPNPVVRLARRLGQVLAEPIELPSGKVRVGVSTGVAFFPVDGETPELLLGRADRALYAAKRDGVGWRLCAELEPMFER